MQVLVTGSNGFIGRNLVWNLKQISEGKNITRSNINITKIYSYDIETDESILVEACRKCDFVFHLAGVNRPKEVSDFMKNNLGFSNKLLETLKRYQNSCPVMFSSSSQASLMGRFRDSEYGKSKEAEENLFFKYAEETGAKVLVYRFPNLFGKWCKPNYNSAVATFCNAIANDLEYVVDSPNTVLELLYIDDLINELLDILEGKGHYCEYPKEPPFYGLKPVPTERGLYCYVPTTYQVSLGEIINLLNLFKSMPKTLVMAEIPSNSFQKKLYSAYLSYLPLSKMTYELQSVCDIRGKFTELMRTINCGQLSISITKPNITRGQHWHNSKWEIFIVISGRGLIQERQIGINPKTGEEYPIVEFEVNGEQLKAVQILPGYTHSITNLSDTEDLITIIWANEPFDKNNPDTFLEKIQGGDHGEVE